MYRAVDRRLGRSVALKVLPSQVAADEDRTRRFIGEARAASALNHPNVATIYDVGEADGVSFIAMEYVEGQTLAGSIGERPMGRAEIVTIATQVVDALEARTCAGHHPSRHQAGQSHADAARSGEGAGLRAGEERGVRAAGHRRRSHRCRLADRGRLGAGHGRLHEPGAGARAGRRSSNRTCFRSAWCSTRWRPAGCRFRGRRP